MTDTTNRNESLNRLWLFGFIAVAVGVPVALFGFLAGVGVTIVGAAFCVVGGSSWALYLAVRAVLTELRQ